MKVLVQRSKASSVSVDGKTVGKIERGMVLLVCLEKGDQKEQVEKAVTKITSLRIFEDDEAKMNLNIEDSGGSILAISQFTLAWDGKKGNRPSFDLSMPPQEAKILFKLFLEKLREKVVVETGEFGANMQVSITNDGPVTFHLSF